MKPDTPSEKYMKGVLEATEVYTISSGQAIDSMKKNVEVLNLICFCQLVLMLVIVFLVVRLCLKKS